MADNEKKVNKVVYFDETLIDLTDDTVSANTLLNGVTAHDASGKIITGVLEPVMDVMVNGTSVVEDGVAEVDAAPSVHVHSYNNLLDKPNLGTAASASVDDFVKKTGDQMSGHLAIVRTDVSRIPLVVDNGQVRLICQNGVLDKGLAVSTSVTTGTLNSSDINYLIKTNTFAPTATNDVTIPMWNNVGSSGVPVYFGASGYPIACGALDGYLRKGAAITASTDLSSLAEGYYDINNIARSDFPVSNAWFGTLIQTNNIYKSQLLFGGPSGEGSLYIRRYLTSSSSWTNWKGFGTVVSTGFSTSSISSSATKNVTKSLADGHVNLLISGTTSAKIGKNASVTVATVPTGFRPIANTPLICAATAITTVPQAWITTAGTVIVRGSGNDIASGSSLMISGSYISA